jgi:hypothetical protein
MKYLNRSFLFLSLLSIVASCAPEANTSKEFVVEATLTASGPLFEGSNTLQAEINTTVADFIKENGISKEEIVDITLTKAVATIDSSNLNLIESINLLVSSDNFPMQNIAFGKLVAEDAESVDLEAAAMQEKLESILFDEKFYVIADATLKSDLEDDLSLGMELEFSINYHKK